MTASSASFDLTGRVALVTGASSGLGARMAEALAAAGAQVVAGARRVDRLDALAAKLTAAGGGRIILVGSVGSLKPLAGLTAYSMSKAAVAMMGKGFAREWARWGVNVNTICPGWIATELNEEWLAGEAGQKLVKGFPRRRV